MIYIEAGILILDNIPKILQYFVPGYWTIFLFKHLCSKNISNYMMNLMACVVSYIFLTVISFLRLNIKPLSYMPDTALINSILAIIMGTILSLLLSFIIYSKWFSKLTVYFFHKTPNENIWEDVIDWENGSNLKIYLKNKKYYLLGHLENIEEKGNDSLIAISAFAKFDVKTNENYKNESSYLNDNDAICVIRFSDVEHIEIF